MKTELEMLEEIAKRIDDYERKSGVSLDSYQRERITSEELKKMKEAA